MNTQHTKPKYNYYHQNTARGAPNRANTPPNKVVLKYTYPLFITSYQGTSPLLSDGQVEYVGTAEYLSLLCH